MAALMPVPPITLEDFSHSSGVSTTDHTVGTFKPILPDEKTFKGATYQLLVTYKEKIDPPYLQFLLSHHCPLLR